MAGSAIVRPHGRGTRGRGGRSGLGTGGGIVWLFRAIGVLLALAGIGLWLFTQSGLLWLPAALIVVAVLLAVIPGVLLELLGVFA